ncbi:hypothetical protein CsSME_00005595 [Camellia sinensis var. sinensis]
MIKSRRLAYDGCGNSVAKSEEEISSAVNVDVDLICQFLLSHCLRCTESFMRENVMEEMRQLQPDDENKQKMLDILKRFHSEEEMDNMDEDVISASICLRGMRGDWRALPTVGILMMDGLGPTLTAM